MELMDVAKDPAVKMKGEDLAHAYDAVRVANKSVCSLLPFPLDFANFLLTFSFFLSTVPLVPNFPSYVFRFLESQLRGQRSQQEEGLKALQQQANQRASGSASSDEQCQVHEGDKAGIQLNLSLRSFAT